MTNSNRTLPNDDIPDDGNVSIFSQEVFPRRSGAAHSKHRCQARVMVGPGKSRVCNESTLYVSKSSGDLHNVTVYSSTVGLSFGPCHVSRSSAAGSSPLYLDLITQYLCPLGSFDDSWEKVPEEAPARDEHGRIPFTASQRQFSHALSDPRPGGPASVILPVPDKVVNRDGQLWRVADRDSPPKPSIGVERRPLGAPR